MPKIIEPPFISKDWEWKLNAPLFRDNARKLGKVGALMANTGDCAILSLDNAKVGALLLLYNANKQVEDVYDYQTPERRYSDVESTDSLSLEAGSASHSNIIKNSYTDGKIIVDVKDKTEFDVNGAVSIANPNNINLLLISRAINEELSKVVDGLAIYGSVDASVINEWKNGNAPTAEPYLSSETLDIGILALSMKWTRLKVEAFSTSALPCFIAFPQGKEGKTLKLTLEIAHSLGLYDWDDPAKNASGQISLNNLFDWSLVFAPIVGSWNNDWTLPIQLGDEVTLSSGSHAIKAKTASESVSVSIKVPSSRVGVLFFRPSFTSGKVYFPMTSQINFTDVSRGLSYDKYQQVMRQRFDYSVNLTARLMLNTASYS